MTLIDNNMKQSDSTIISIELVQKLLNSMIYGVIIADKTGNFIYWNEPAKLIMSSNSNSQQQEWIDDFGVYTTDKSRKYLTEELPMSKGLRGEISKGEKMFVKNIDIPNGVYLKVNGFPIYNEDGIIDGAAIIFEDITEEQLMYDSVISKINELEIYLKEILNIDYDEVLLKKLKNEKNT